MEVGQQRVCDPEIARRVEEDASPAGPGSDGRGCGGARARGRATSERLEDADRRGAHGDDATPGTFGQVDHAGGFFAYLVALFVHRVRRDGFGLYWREGPEPDMQGEEANLHTARADFIQQ